MAPATAWPALLLFLALLAPLGLGQAPGGTGVEYELRIDCPETFQSVGTVPCPVRATDAQDMMGDPSVAVDPLDPANLILASLHGGVNGGGAAGTGQVCEPGPSPKSRCGQVFTTFTSTDHGASWLDNPFVPPEDVGRDAYGEHPQVTIDPYGHVYVGSLYAMPKGNDRFDYVIAAQKFASLDTIDQEQDGEYHTQFLDPVFPGNRIGQMWFLFNPQTDNMTIVWNEQPPASTPVSGAGGKAAGSPSPTTAAGAGLPGAASGLLGAGPGADAGSGGPGGDSSAAQQADEESQVRSVLGVVWSTSSTKSPYHYQREEYAVGPCLTSTNPVLSEGWLYIGCVSRDDEGPFPWHPDGTPGAVEMFRMDPNGGEPQYLGAAPLIGGSPKLGARSDGRLALVTANAADGALAVDAVFGQYDANVGRVVWGGVRHLGQDIRPIDPGVRIVAANIQDMIYREHSGVLHMVLKERIEPQGIGLSALRATAAPKIQKSIVAIDETYGALAKMNLDIGNLVNRTDPALLQAPEIAYDDLSDDFLQLPLQDTYAYSHPQKGELILGPAYAREFFAVGDYGTVIFAEVIEITNLRGPAAVPPAAPPPPIPAAASSLSATQVLLPAAGITVTALIAASFIVNRRKDVNAAIAKHRK